MSITCLLSQNCDGVGRVPPTLIVGNKIDCSEEDREVSTEAGTEAATEFGALFAEVSALEGTGVHQVRGGARARKVAAFIRGGGRQAAVDTRGRIALEPVRYEL